jgi:hypothetical protein
MGFTNNENDMINEWNLPSSNKLPVTLRRMRLLIPINDVLMNINQQAGEAGTHWSLLTCDIQASKEIGVCVQFRHFDSLKNSSLKNSKNFDTAEFLAGRLHVSLY